LRYLNTGASPFDKWAEEYLPDGEVNLPVQSRRTVEEI
jgi:hypothetical protein